MRLPVRIAGFFASLVALGITSGLLVTVVAYFYLAPTLPDVDTFRDVKLQVPLRIFTRDGRLIAEFGDKRRIPLSYDELPEPLVRAFISAEDDRYFEHPGVDYQGLVRAVIKLVQRGGRRSQGGSTITMQLARNIFLIPDKTYKRKLQEIFLALKMESEFGKEEILALYLNKIFLGQRAYGVGAAAEVYFGKTVNELTLGETALIAGLPQSPSNDNPVRSKIRAMARRGYVLRRMLELGYIDQQQHDLAANEPVESRLHGPTVAVSAPYVAEMVRAQIEEQFGREAINEGYRVITSLDSRLQHAAVDSLRLALDKYDQRHGYRGPLGQIDDLDTLAAEEIDARLRDYPRVAKLLPAVVTAVDEQTATLHAREQEPFSLPVETLSWAKKFITDSTVGDAIESATQVLNKGDVVYVRLADEGFVLAQQPAVQGALVSVDPQDGAITSLSGGYDFYQSKFNRVTQAKRQPGSSFKPFIYYAALEAGLTPATIINDAPVVFEDWALEDVWRPVNFSKRTYGPTRLREALVRSRNLVSIRVLNKIGIDFAIDQLQHFGFDQDILPHDLSLALGSAAVTPLEIALAYGRFSNGGYEILPYFIDRIENSDHEVVFAAEPALVCSECVPVDLIESDSEEEEPLLCDKIDDVMTANVARQVLSPQSIYLMTTMMHDVVTRGTGAKANQLKRTDLAGKTGTTNDHRDAWFAGFNRFLAATVWVGFDRERPLGRAEMGGTTALPGWISFMASALDGLDQLEPREPEGLVTVRIERDTGLLASSETDNAIFETFVENNIPEPTIVEYGGKDEEDLYQDEGIF